MTKFISFLFHKLTEDDPSEIMEVSKSLFERCLFSIKEASIPVMCLGDLVKLSYTNSYKSKRAISITFDDGWDSDYKIAFPMLKGYGFKATFFITTDWINKKGYVKEVWLKEMSQYGMEIGSHTLSHRYLTRLSEDEVYKEFYDSKCRLEDILGREVTAVSIPGGEYNGKIIKLAYKTGYKIIATSKPGINQAGSTLVNRISIHSRTSLADLEKIISFSPFSVFQLKSFYLMRALIKKTFGIDGYLRLRDWLVKEKGRYS